jgi:hypothetical protein
MQEEEKSSVEVIYDEGSEFMHEEVSEPPSSGELAFPLKKCLKKSTKR